MLESAQQVTATLSKIRKFKYDMYFLAGQGSAGSGGGAVIETSTLASNTRLGDTFASSVNAGAGANPHTSHFYGSAASIGVISPPSLDTLGLSSGANVINGATAGATNGE